MIIRNVFSFFLPLLVILFFSCTKAVETRSQNPESRMIRVWALADIQARNGSERISFTESITDVNNSIPGIDFAIVAGDIVNRAESETFNWYLKERNKSYIDKWYEIAGNHDLKSDEGKMFSERIRKEMNYTVEHGNLLFIFISDEKGGKPTDITNETFEWWKETVKNNQDKIIITVTHAPLEGSEIPFSTYRDRQILDSKRFRDVLKENKVDLWLSGHLHLPNEFTNTINQNEELNGTVFIHISSIRPEFAGLKHSESRILEFYCDDNKLKIRSRDHKTQKWNAEIEQTVELSKPVECII